LFVVDATQLPLLVTLETKALPKFA